MTEIYSLNHHYYQVLQNHHQKICTYIKKHYIAAQEITTFYSFFVIITTVYCHTTLDIEFAYNYGLPGILYDYSAENLIGGTYKGAPYKTYTFGPMQRTF